MRLCWDFYVREGVSPELEMEVLELHTVFWIKVFLLEGKEIWLKLREAKELVVKNNYIRFIRG